LTNKDRRTDGKRTEHRTETQTDRNPKAPPESFSKKNSPFSKGIVYPFLENSKNHLNFKLLLVFSTPKIFLVAEMRERKVKK
jgi:hypothetical protein